MTGIVDRALVLRTWEFSETSQTVSLFTLSHGAIRGLAKGSRREKSAFGGGLEALTIGNVVFRVRSASELALVTEWTVEEIFWGPRSSLLAHRAALYASELIGAFITDREAHPGLFHGAERFLRSIAEPEDVQSALLALQWGVLVETGHRPRIDPTPDVPADSRVLGFDPEAGTIVADPGPDQGRSGASIWRVRRETIDRLRELDATPDAPAEPRAADVRTNRFLAAFCRYHLGREPKTFRILFGARSPDLPGG